MCGFVGFLTSGQWVDDEATYALVSRMADRIMHRGPDYAGYWNDETIGISFGHRRLAIVDRTPAGAQPMQSSCGRFVINFNGEIYNHMSLRAEFENSSVSTNWRGHSDTETLLTCFETWGLETTLSKVVGMFAIALWDKQERALTLARDRMGEKPLYWGWQGDTLLFGSELKALEVHPDFVGEIDRNALALLLRHNYIPAPHSIYKGINKLPAGNYVTIHHGAAPTDVQPQSYWRMNDAVQNGLGYPFKGNDAQAVDALDAQLSESIGLQMLADVPLGAFLSGGVDSSTIVALMQKQSQQRVRTFAIGFNEPGYNEAENAKAVARYLGTEHTELYVGAQEALAVIPKLPHMYCEPFADSSQIPTYLVSQMARQHVTVALSGDGGDELFGGYNPYQFLPRVWKSLAWLPAPLRSALQSVIEPLPLPDKLAKLREVMGASTQQDLYRQVLSHWPNPESLVLGVNEPATLLNTPEAWPSVESFEHWMMAMDAQTYMVDDVLTKVDRAAMANSLETRVPFLDHRVVELAWRLPLHMKIRDGQGKWVLRQVLYKHVPKELIERPKKGFSIPLAAWLRGPLRDWAEALLNETRLKAEGYLAPEPIRKAWLAHVQGKADYSTRLWGVLMFQAWLEEQHRA
jgi:asparagine synthase (glutamine-hydrolysing)